MRTLVLMLLLAAPAYADSLLYDITARPFDSPELTLTGSLTVQVFTGQYFVPWYGAYFSGSVYQVLSIDGTYLGQPISLIPNQQPGPAWIGVGLSPLITFSNGDGNAYRVWSDALSPLITMIQPDGFGTNTRVDLRITYAGAVPVPEDSTWLLLAIGLSCTKIAGPTFPQRFSNRRVDTVV
jgi:hypothetical protein